MNERTAPKKEEHLSHQEAVKKIQEIAKHARSCLFGTYTGQWPLNVRPMAVQQVDDRGHLWILSGHSSDKNAAIARDSRVQLIFANGSKYEYLSLEGTAAIHTERAVKEKYWTPFAKSWFEQGVDDPDLTVLEITPTAGYYWDTEDGKTVTTLKMAVGAMTGKNMNIGVSGKISP